MGLLILTIMGAIFGWLAAIVAQSDSMSGIASNVVAGSIGAVLIGEVANPGSIVNGLSATALVLAVAGAILFISVTNLVRRRV